MSCWLYFCRHLCSIWFIIKQISHRPHSAFAHRKKVSRSFGFLLQSKIRDIKRNCPNGCLFLYVSFALWLLEFTTASRWYAESDMVDLDDWSVCQMSKVNIGTLSHFELTSFKWLKWNYHWHLNIRNMTFDCFLQHFSWVSLQCSLCFLCCSDVFKIQEGIGDKVSIVIQSYTTFFSSLIIGLYKGWKITLVILAVTPLLGLLTFINNKVSVIVSVFSALGWIFLIQPSHNGVFPRVDGVQDHFSRAECLCQSWGLGKGGPLCCPNCVCLQRSEERDRKVNAKHVSLWT